MAKKITFIGAGEIGTALAAVLRKSKKNPEIALWDRDPQRCSKKQTLAEALHRADAVFFCVPSRFVREAIANALPYIDRRTIVISLAKGIEADDLKTMDQVFGEMLPKGQPYGVLGGPMLAEELVQGLPAVGILAAAERSAYEAVAAEFAGTCLRLEWTADVHAAALAGVLKNVYAAGIGIAEGLRLGENAKGWLASQAVREMFSVMKKVGINDPEVVHGPAGIGDFVATAFSAYSRNHQLGVGIVVNGTCDTGSESCVSLPSVVRFVDGDLKNLPLLDGLNKVILEHADPKETFSKILSGS